MHKASTLGLWTGLLAGVAKAQYTLDVLYDAANFFDEFTFFSEADPTHGFVEYVEASVANTDGLAGIVDGAVFMGADAKTMNPEHGRRSVRLTSTKAFNHGLFIADIPHMPTSTCGSWPAFWMFGPDWPHAGEVDIIEGVNTAVTNSITLHTGPGCHVRNEGSMPDTLLEATDCGFGQGHRGCPQLTASTQNYGDGFNDIQGGVYATEWTSDHIAVWFFPRAAIPGDIAHDKPDPSSWGPATARFVPAAEGVKLDDYFRDNSLVFSNTFCGDWAGSPDVWDSNAECSAAAATCEEFVAGNPAAFEDSYWLVNSIKVFQQPQGSTKSQAVPSYFSS